MEQREPDGLRVSLDLTGREPVIVLEGFVDQSTTPLLRDAITEIIEGGAARVTIDFRAVTFMDSSGIGVLANAYKQGVAVTVHQPSPTVMRELVMCGLDRLVSID